MTQKCVSFNTTFFRVWSNIKFDSTSIVLIAVSVNVCSIISVRDLKTYNVRFSGSKLITELPVSVSRSGLVVRNAACYSLFAILFPSDDVTVAAIEILQYYVEYS